MVSDSPERQTKGVGPWCADFRHGDGISVATPWEGLWMCKTLEEKNITEKWFHVVPKGGFALLSQVGCCLGGFVGLFLFLNLLVSADFCVIGHADASML